MLGDLLNKLLKRAGLEGEAAREVFLRPVYARDLHDPFLLKGMKAAVERIAAAIKNQEKIVIFADYDADGVPGAAVLSEWFRQLGYQKFDVYIPDRQTEAHGLSLKFIEAAARAGAQLVITIDCGSSNLAEAARARELGLDLIITDHHLLPDPLPAAFAIINPKQSGDEYPEKMLCGAGVAFKLVQALNQALKLQNVAWEKSLLDLVAIATIADRVPLVGENRALAKFGLLMLQRTRRPGLLALMNAAKLNRAYVNEDDVGFTLGPRINAAGRMGQALTAYRLLVTSNRAEAEGLAAHLETQNSDRKLLVEEILKTAKTRLLDSEPPPLIVLGHPDWPPAVLGLAASRLAESYNRPVFLYGRNEAGDWKGSCRTAGQLNVVELMRAASLGEPLFTDLGGHMAAGGFSISPEIAPSGVEGLQQILSSRLLAAYEGIAKAPPEVSLEADLEIGLDEVTPGVWQELEQLAPFGAGHPKPVFKLAGVKPAKVKTFGTGGIHLELGFKKENGIMVKAVGFFDVYPHLELEAGDTIHLLATLEKSYFGGRAELRLRIVDINPA